MNLWFLHVSLVLGANIFFIKGIGLEVLGFQERFRFADVLRLWGWNLLASVLMTIIRLTLPVDWNWMVPLILPTAALVLWLLFGLFETEENQLLPLLAQTAALGTSLLLMNLTDLGQALFACFTVSLGYLISLVILREVSRFLPDEIPSGARFSLLMLGFALAATGFGLFHFGAGRM